MQGREDMAGTSGGNQARVGCVVERVDCVHVVRAMACAVSPDLGRSIVMEMLDGLDLFEH